MKILIKYLIMLVISVSSKQLYSEFACCSYGFQNNLSYPVTVYITPNGQRLSLQPGETGTKTWKQDHSGSGVDVTFFPVTSIKIYKGSDERVSPIKENNGSWTGNQNFEIMPEGQAPQDGQFKQSYYQKGTIIPMRSFGIREQASRKAKEQAAEAFRKQITPFGSL